MASLLGWICLSVVLLGWLPPLRGATTTSTRPQLVIPGTPSSPISDAVRDNYRQEVREMFEHAYGGYLTHAFPHDELKPMTGEWTDSLAELGNLVMSGLPSNYTGVAMTLIESISTLAVMGNTTGFSWAVRWVSANVNFDQDIRVNVFEANIRLVGGLVSAHLLATDEELQLMDQEGEPYQGQLLALAHDIATRLLPAFDTPTKVPYAWVNLRVGVLPGETTEQNTAGGGTFLLEFGMLSVLTSNWTFATVAREAMHGLWQLRSSLDLLGNTLDIVTGKWLHGHAGVGAGSDSFYEYLIKCYILFDDRDCWLMWQAAYKALQIYSYKAPWYVEASMTNGNTVYAEAQGLQAFWPAVQVLHGDIKKANETHRAFHQLWQRYGVLPERHSLVNNELHRTERYYLLRPEHAESTYYLSQATIQSDLEPDWFYLHAAHQIVEGIRNRARTPYGYASIHDVMSGEQENRMCSFFLSETIKYLYLVFDRHNFVHGSSWIFTTEGHLIRLPPANSSSIRRLWRHQFPSQLNGFSGNRVCKNLVPVPVPVPVPRAAEDQETKLPVGAASLLSSWEAGAVEKSACHVPDRDPSGKCKNSAQCGVAHKRCIQRQCSEHGWCFTPRA